MGSTVFFKEVVEDVPDEDFISTVLEMADGRGYFAYQKSPTGSHAGVIHQDYGDAYTDLLKMQDHTKRFWQEKVNWKDNGDLTDKGSHCLRINGQHFVAKPGIVSDRSDFLGYGGRRFAWKSLVDNKTYVSNNVWHQGVIPPQWRVRLPDNAVWID